MSDVDYQRLAVFYEGDDVWIWGASPGVHSRWARIQTGDIVMFYRDKRFIRTASVTFICQNRSLAIELWGRDPNNETWEYIYFVGDPHETDIPVQAFCAVVPYKPNFTPQGLMVLDQQKSDRVLEAFDLEGGGRGFRPIIDPIDISDAQPDRPTGFADVKTPESLDRMNAMEALLVEVRREFPEGLESKIDALMHEVAGARESLVAVSEFMTRLESRIDDLAKETQRSQANSAQQIVALLEYHSKGFLGKLFSKPRWVD